MTLTGATIEVAVTSGVATGVGTLFTAEVSVGDIIVIDNVEYTVSAVTSNLLMTLDVGAIPAAVAATAAAAAAVAADVAATAAAIAPAAAAMAATAAAILSTGLRISLYSHGFPCAAHTKNNPAALNEH